MAMDMWTESDSSDYDAESAHSDHMVLPRGHQPVENRLRRSWRVLAVVALAVACALVAALSAGSAAGGAADTPLKSKDVGHVIQKSLKNEIEEMAGDAVDETKEAVGNLEDGLDDFLKKHGDAINETVETAEQQIVEVLEEEIQKAKGSNETIQTYVEGAQEAVDSVLDEAQNVLDELASTTDGEASPANSTDGAASTSAASPASSADGAASTSAESLADGEMTTSEESSGDSKPRALSSAELAKLFD